MVRPRVLCAAFALVMLVSGSAFADGFSIFDFESLLPGTFSPFSLTNNGLTATFSSPDGPGAFAVVPGFFFTSPIQGNVLQDLDPVPHPLNIQFSESRGKLSLDFALDTFGSPAGVLTLEAFLNGNLVGSASSAGAFPPGGFIPQGSLFFTGAVFDSVRLTSTSSNFAIDNMSVALPVPSTLLLMILGLGVLALLGRRQTAG